ncbi:MAG: lysozyme inhibitor LprI family protein [Vitreimonas sp.]
MRVLLVAMLALTGACGGGEWRNDAPQPLWRRAPAYLEADRQLARTCLQDAQRACEDVIQQACGAESSFEPSAQWLCDSRAIAAWEDEMEAMLVRLRPRLARRDRADLNASQRAWVASMRANVALAMDRYEGGSLASTAGAHVRARATAQRARYLADMLLMTD